MYAQIDSDAYSPLFKLSWFQMATTNNANSDGASAGQMAAAAETVVAATATSSKRKTMPTSFEANDSDFCYYEGDLIEWWNSLNDIACEYRVVAVRDDGLMVNWALNPDAHAWLVTRDEPIRLTFRHKRTKREALSSVQNWMLDLILLYMGPTST